MAKRKMTSAQRSRQAREHRERGKYAKVNPCCLCDKSAGVNAGGHILTDCAGSDGVPFHDIAIVLCSRCENDTRNMTTTAEILAYKKTVSPKK